MDRSVPQTISASIYNYLLFIDIDAFREKTHVLRTYPSAYGQSPDPKEGLPAMIDGLWLFYVAPAIFGLLIGFVALLVFFYLFNLSSYKKAFSLFTWFLG